MCTLGNLEMKNMYASQKELRALQPDGTIVTETRHTKEQEQHCDEDLSKDEVSISLVFDSENRSK